MISRIVITTLAVAHGLQQTQATVNAHATPFETQNTPSGKSSVMRRQLTQVATLTAEGDVQHMQTSDSNAQAAKEGNDRQDDSPSTSETAHLLDFELAGEIGLILSPGVQGFAKETTNQLAVCNGIVGIVFAEEVPRPDCKITSYLQDSDTEPRFQFKLTIPRQDYDENKYMLENADKEEIAESICSQCGIDIRRSITIHDQQGHKPYTGVRGALVLSAQCTDDNECKPDLLDIISSTEVHKTVRRAIAEVCGVQPTEVVVVIDEGSFQQQDQKRNPEDKDLIMSCAFYIHSGKAWKLRKLVKHASIHESENRTFATLLNNAIVAHSLQTALTPFSVDRLYADMITADEMAAVPPAHDAWDAGDTTADEVGEIGGWLNFSTDEYDQFFDHADAQMAIQGALADVGYVREEQIKINLHRSPPLELGDIVKLTKFNQGDVETVAVQWTAYPKKKYMKLVIAKFEKANLEALATKIREKDEGLHMKQITVLALTCDSKKLNSHTVTGASP